jgi:uncharacterized protein YycO
MVPKGKEGKKKKAKKAKKTAQVSSSDGSDSAVDWSENDIGTVYDYHMPGLY